MNKETKIIIAIGAFFFLIFLAFIYFGSKPPAPIPPQVISDTSLLVKKDSHQTSPDKAKVTLVEFGDFQCPACGISYPIVKQLEKDYGDNLNVVFRHFPLPQHTNALPASEAAEAAGAQGKFWEMHDKLYENQDKWSSEANPINTFAQYAKDLNLDVDKFTSDVKGEKYKDKIVADQSDGNTVAISATPTFFLNGQKIEGLPALEQFKSLIDQKLK
ncbi:MAG TPA: thioredoxin domain-containing protein [Patescibacteria group bacterium]